MDTGLVSLMGGGDGAFTFSTSKGVFSRLFSSDFTSVLTGTGGLESSNFKCFKHCQDKKLKRTAGKQAIQGEQESDVQELAILEYANEKE